MTQEIRTSRLGREGRDQPYRNLQTYVLHELGRLIVAGRIAPGDALPTEPQLAEEFEVGVSVIREATRGLAAKGLVQARARLGTRVRPQSEWHMLDPDILSWQLAAEPDHDLLRDFEEFRLMVEPASARLAAQRATAADRAAIGRALERMREGLETPEDYFAADLDFHALLLNATHNRMLQGLQEAVKSALVLRHASVGPVLTGMHESLPYHEHVLDAVEDGHPDEAEAQMQELLRLTGRDDARLRAERSGTQQPPQPHDAPAAL